MANEDDKVVQLPTRNLSQEGKSGIGATIVEEWVEIVTLMGMLVDRIDRLAVRAGCKNRRELMLKLARSEPWKSPPEEE